MLPNSYAFHRFSHYMCTLLRRKLSDEILRFHHNHEIRLDLDDIPGATAPERGDLHGAAVLHLLVVAEATAGPLDIVMAAVILLMLMGMFWN